MLRKLALTGLLQFVQRGTATQVFCGLPALPHEPADDPNQKDPHSSSRGVHVGRWEESKDEGENEVGDGSKGKLDHRQVESIWPM